MSKAGETTWDSPTLQETLGPTLPSGVECENMVDNGCLNDLKEQFYGPSLPKHLRNDVKTCETNAYGPELPVSSFKKGKIIGPEIPVCFLSSTSSDEPRDDSTVEEIYGPSPSLMLHAGTEIPLPSVSRKMSQKETSGVCNKRESWMLELPPDKAVNFGLCPRQFRMKMTDDKDRDRSVWIETPASEKKSLRRQDDDRKKIKRRQIEERDKQMERLIENFEKKKTEKSLVEIHRKKIKKEAKEAKRRKKEKKQLERRPFDRNIDLQANRFDESQKRAVLKKAQLLNDRFAQGESKFL